ncbi:MAG: HesB/IscA family protein [Bdellovibrionales bacterium]
MSLIIDDTAVKRIQELRKTRNQPALMLRVTVEGGGCSGFQYKLDLTDEIKDKDLQFANTIVTDDISMPFINGATLRFKSDLIGSEFIIDNPNAQSGCGCGSSFAI